MPCPLRRAVEREGISLTEAARRVGMSTGQFSHLIYGDRVPTIESANRIAEQWPAVEVSLWTAAPSRSFTPPAAREEAS